MCYVERYDVLIVLSLVLSFDSTFRIESSIDVGCIRSRDSNVPEKR